jgi:hypothetical protein
MGKLIASNEHINYWVCGLIFVILYTVVLGVLSFVSTAVGMVAALVGLALYILVMPYVSGRLVDYISDKWMD